MVVRPEGFEPSTVGIEAPCSVQLSYGRSWLQSEDPPLLFTEITGCCA